jgi:hypothetical protein
MDHVSEELHTKRAKNNGQGKGIKEYTWLKGLSPSLFFTLPNGKPPPIQTTHIPILSHFYLEDEGETFLWNVGKHLQDNMATQCRRQQST